MANTFGTTEIAQETKVQASGKSKTIIILLIIIIASSLILGYLLYIQSKEPAPVLEEVSQTIDIPENPVTDPAAGISEPISGETIPEKTLEEMSSPAQ
jgi:flagellar basal body-associated protein FliL